MIKERKYPLLRKAKDQARWNCEVRRRLYALVKNMRAVKAYHIESWEQGTGHQTPCDVCKRLENEVAGVKSAIRHFGGYPR